MIETVCVEQLPAVLTVKEIEALLHISHNTAYSLVRSGAIQSIKIGRLYRIPRDSVIEFLLRKF